MVRKPSMGRQKIEIKRIQQEEARQVTFSKRRAGLFKKASELCILCSAETAIIVFSPAGKAFSFGHPCVESIIDRFLNKKAALKVNPMLPLVEPQRGRKASLDVDPTLSFMEAQRREQLTKLKQEYTNVLNELEAEKKRGDALKQLRKASKNQAWWEAPIDDLGLHELEQLRVSMEDLKRNVANRGDELLMDTSFSSFLPVNSIGMVDPFDVKPHGGSTSIIPHGYGFGFGHGLY